MQHRIIVLITVALLWSPAATLSALAADAAAQAPQAAAAPPAQAGAPADAGAPAEPAKDKPLPFGQLALVAVPPEKSQFSLQVGMSEHQEALAPLAARLAANGYPTRTIEVEDSGQQQWFVLAAGLYPTLEEAKTARYSLRTRLALPGRIIILPPKEDKK